ncbi:uncharacterized protein LOC107681309 [Sinocyclocheilus anshuiensis]|uniref:uncharacterized protein LOC107681309 n=1 Tax=Sinocyclocheilus anshuiensis TaxID=1608454 RepID=UPI0007B87C2F|nr:PREDICTED: uncharacterized protein LOC107681309 [Sinocyclocheilus anshuiensis]
MWSTTAKNGTAVKLTNTTNKPDPNSKSFSIHCDRNTVMEVIDVNFPHKPPIETQLMYVEDIKLLGPKQHVTKLQATVVKVNPPTTVNAWDTACEIKECFLRDKTGQIMLTLWDKLVTLVELNNTYEFEHMQTRAFRGIPTLTSSRSTIIKPIQQSKVFLAGQEPKVTEDLDIQTTKLISKPQGAKIQIHKLCPKCHQSQHNFNPKQQLHRCTTCKVLRQGKNYLTKCSGIIESGLFSYNI